MRHPNRLEETMRNQLNWFRTRTYIIADARTVLRLDMYYDIASFHIVQILTFFS